MTIKIMSLADLRRDYNLAGLRRRDLESDPVAQFNRWIEQAAGTRGGGRLRRFCIGLYKVLVGAGPADVTAMTLATVDAQGRPSARIVLLKGVDERGFIFFTNYESRKGNDLTANPHAALVFYWPDQERQVTIAGEVTKISPAESDAYFNSRPRGSRLAAWASRQSEIVKDRTELEHKWNALVTRYAHQEVPRPPYWGGYVLAPERMEFWQGRPNRLHDRFRYTRQANKQWQVERLSP